MLNSRSDKQENPNTDLAARLPVKNDLLIVGIGASAGGIQALREFFENVPANSDMAYVVILHLSPDHDSQLAEVLQVVSKIPVTQVTEKILVQPNHVYVVPPNQHLEIFDEYITVTPNLSIEERRAPVDIFFRTLAESHREKAIAVVLSGTGADGSMGIKRIKERGGAAFVQNPREAEYSDMPRNSIATELIDAVLNVHEIPARIIAYKNSLGKVNIPLEPEERQQDQLQALRETFTQLRVRTGHDFSNYKSATVLRRIERRMNVHSMTELPDYAHFIRENTGESLALLKDLLISVTNFFRDKESFNHLEFDIIPRILKNKKAGDQVRIWCMGCATGEEAYSLAILFAERTFDISDAPSIQIFATDIDEQALATARDGLYTLNDATDVSPERLRRFFNKESDEFRVRRELREMILFANHNVLKDPPFSHLDLVTCRNMLIYLNGTAQQRVMETFHFALEPGGYLFLGNSESVAGSGDLFAPLIHDGHIFQSRQTGGKRTIPLPEHAPAFLKTQQTRLPAIASEQETRAALERITYADLHQQFLEQYAPPSIVVNEEYEIAHLSVRAGRYLQIAGGEPSKNLLKLIRPELRLELRSALYQAVQKKTNIEVANLKVKIDDATETLNIKVRPVLRADDTARGFVLILFQQTEGINEDNGQIISTSPEPVARQLEEELLRTKSQLRQSVEQYEIQTEELRASNEELQAMNKELRSAAEELETSKEELQSINEELTTVNQELKIKIEEISNSNNNFQNLINSSEIGTIFLDHGLRVNFFSPTAREIFNLIPADFGRPLSDITHRLEYHTLPEDAETVLHTLQTIEREVQTIDKRYFLMRVLPYRTSEDRINGIIVTFVNITQRKQKEEEVIILAHEIEQQSRVFNTALTSISDFSYIFNRNGRFEFSNKPLLDLLGISLKEITGKNFFDLNYPQDLAARLQKQIQHVFDTKELVRDETPFINPESKQGFYEYIFTPVFSTDGSTVDFVAGSTRDVTHRKKIEKNLNESKERFRLMTDAVPQLIWTNDSTGKADYFNMRWYEYSGLNYEESVGLGWEAIVHTEDAPSSKEDWHRALAAGEIFDTEYRLRHADGKYRWHIGRNIPVFNEEGNITGWFGTATDIHDLKMAQDLLEESKERLQVTMESATDYAIITMDTEGKIEGWSAGAERTFGYTPEEVTGKSSSIIFTKEDIEKGEYEKEMNTARKEGRAADERWHVRKDGSKFYMSGVLTTICNSKNTGFVKVARDMTQQKQAEEVLRISEERHRIALQSAEMAAWDWNVAEDKIIWNEEHYTIFGLDPDNKEKEPSDFLQFVHEDDLVRVKKALSDALDTTGVYQAEFRIKRADNNETRWMSGYGRVVSRNGEQVTRMVGVMFDINHRKKLEQQKDDFISIASHELKTPVTSIKAYAEVLYEMFGESDTSGAALIGKLDAQVDRLIELIRALLDTSKMGEGELQLNIQECNLNKLIIERVEDLQQMSPVHRIIVSSDKELFITADCERIGQVLINLISNAVKYSPQGGDIIINWQQKADNVEVSVSDNGIGIADGLQKKVFERFFREKNAQVQTFPGMGLGLYISANIIHRHGGTIWVESKQGEGSTFYFTLPLRR